MQKSIYSLVLNDEVVAEIDRIAYAEGTSRSSLINRILAEKVRLTTPEMRTRDIFKRVDELLSSDVFRALGEPSESTFQMRSALSYKYNPTVRYQVAVAPSETHIGELRVSVRSRSDALTLTMLQFFRLWSVAEQVYIGETDCVIEPNRFTRRLVPHNKKDGGYAKALAGDAIAAYIAAFDGAMKAYFGLLDKPGEASAAVEAYLADYVRNNTVIL